MSSDLVNPVFIGDRRCDSLWKAARRCRQAKRESRYPADVKSINGSRLYMHPTKGYRDGPHYPTSRRKALVMRRGHVLVAMLTETLA